MLPQVAVTIRAWLKPGAFESLDTLLSQVRDDVERNPLVPFAAFDNIHFARFVILPEAKDLDGNIIAPSLIYAANVDGDGDAHVRELVRVAAEGLDRIFAHCADYPAQPNQHNRFEYLNARRIPTQAFYVNTVGRTARQVREEAALREALEQELDRAVARGESADARAIRTRLQQLVQSRAELDYARQPAGRLPLGWRIRERLTFFGTLLLLLLLSPVMIVVVGVLLLRIRSLEKADARRRRPLRISDEEQFDLRLHEDQVVQNQISAVGCAKRGALRRITLRVLLWALNFAARHIFNRGDLGTFKLLKLYGVDTIHFAQWIVIDDGKRVVFFSNYDGSLVSYMDDFVNKVAWGLNAVFSNGEGYPNTRWLVLDGAHDEQQFKAFLHKHQIPTQAWYSAHKRYTARNLSNNAEIRRGLFSDEPDTRWLARL